MPCRYSSDARDEVYYLGEVQFVNGSRSAHAGRSHETLSFNGFDLSLSNPQHDARQKNVSRTMVDLDPS